MTKLNVQKYPEASEAALFAGYALNKILEDNKNKAALLIVSGGSALQILDGVNPEHLSDQTTIAMLDERFSADPSVNNFSQLQKTDFYKEALGRECIFFGSLPRPGETKEQLAERMEKNLRQWCQDNVQGKIFATLGMGADGHIAGIMPFPEDEKKFKELFEGQRWVAAYDAGNKNIHSERVTATLPFLHNIEASIAYITGTEKHTVLERVLKKASAKFELPAMVFWDLKNLEIYTDLK